MSKETYDLGEIQGQGEKLNFVRGGVLTSAKVEQRLPFAVLLDWCFRVVQAMCNLGYKAHRIWD